MAKYIGVMYLDGACKPNPGRMGSGAHGFLYDIEKLNTKSGNKPSKYVISNIGYIEQASVGKDKHETLVPDYYVDASYSFKEDGTNNIAEVRAFTITVDELIDKCTNADIELTELVIKSDSSYTLNMINTVMKKSRSDWEPKINVNKECWERVFLAVEKLKHFNIILKLSKVEGHSDDLGNHLADRLAYLGRLESARGNYDNRFFLQDEKRYWKSGDNRHTLLRYTQMFFLNNLRMTETVPTYSIIDYKTGVEPGMKSNDALFGLVTFKERDMYIENIISMYQKFLKELSIISSVNLSVLYSRDLEHYHNLFGNSIFLFDFKRDVLYSIFSNNTNGNASTADTIGDVPVVNAVRPAGLATNAIEKTIGLYDIIKDYGNVKNGGDSLRVFIDITDKIYGVDAKGKPVTLLEASQKYLKLTYDINGREVTFPLELGKDSIDRNQFKKLEKSKPRVYIVAMLVSEEYMEYYTMIELDDDTKAAYCNFYSNRIFLPKKK